MLTNTETTDVAVMNKVPNDYLEMLPKHSKYTEGITRVISLMNYCEDQMISLDDLLNMAGTIFKMYTGKDRWYIGEIENKDSDTVPASKVFPELA